MLSFISFSSAAWFINDSSKRKKEPKRKLINEWSIDTCRKTDKNTEEDIRNETGFVTSVACISTVTCSGRDQCTSPIFSFSPLLDLLFGFSGWSSTCCVVYNIVAQVVRTVCDLPRNHRFLSRILFWVVPAHNKGYPARLSSYPSLNAHHNARSDIRLPLCACYWECFSHALSVIWY